MEGDPPTYLDPDRRQLGVSDPDARTPCGAPCLDPIRRRHIDHARLKVPDMPVDVPGSNRIAGQVEYGVASDLPGTMPRGVAPAVNPVHLGTGCQVGRLIAQQVCRI